MNVRLWRHALITLLLAADVAAATRLTIVPSTLPAASRLAAVDLAGLGSDLERAGLTLPPSVQVTLIPEGDLRARNVPEWIVGLAIEPDEVVIFPDRLLSYPYESLESVFRHEVAHLALSARAGGRTLPRWFDEGVAVCVDAGWGISGRLQLLLEMTRNPMTADLARLFATDALPTLAQAYGLSAALVADLQRRHGTPIVGAIAARVATDVPFADAFQLETGLPPDAAAQRAWAAYRRWWIWVSVVTSEVTVWGLIVGLALLAFIVKTRQRARRRRQWDHEEAVDPPLN